MEDWMSPKVELPQQGKKFIWFKDGETHICSRYGNKYLTVSPYGGKILDEPLLWKDLDMPDPYNGLTYIRINGSETDLTIDEFEIEYPEKYKVFVDGLEDRRF